MGSTYMVDVPCWAHLLNILGSEIFDGNRLSVLHEYLRLTRCRPLFVGKFVQMFHFQGGLCKIPILAEEVD